MSVDDMYKICEYAINKAQNGYLSPNEFNLLVNQAQNSWMDYLLGQFQQYQYQRAQAKVSYGQNSNVRQRLQPFIYNYTLSVNSLGFASYPADFVQADAMWTYYNYKRVRWTPQDKVYSVFNSTIDPIADNPAYMTEDTGFTFLPNSIGSARLSYVRKPTRIYWNYTLDVNGRQVYNPATSEQPKWADVDIFEIISRVLKLAGLNLKDGDVINYANSIISTGQ